MDQEITADEKCPEEELQEIEATINKWKHATDAESRWALSLLRYAASKIRREIAKARVKS